MPEWRPSASRLHALLDVKSVHALAHTTHLIYG